MKIMSCNFNMDTGCVELKFFDGSMSPLIVPEWRMRLRQYVSAV